MAAIEVRTLTSDDWQLSRDLRLTALRDSPGAFLSTAAREEAYDETLWRSRTPTTAVAFRDRDAVGIVGWYRPDPAVQRLDLVSMWVRADARGSAAATRLVEHVIAVAGTELELVLGVMADNVRARALYERMGFVTVSDADPDGIATGSPMQMVYAPAAPPD